MNGFLVAVIVGLGIAMLVARLQTASDMSRVASLSELAPEIGRLAHELQNERGLSAGLIGSANDGAFRDRLMEQRQATDMAISRLIEELNALDSAALGSELTADVRAVQAAFEKLPATRQSVDSRTLSLDAMSVFYGHAVASLLSVIEHMGRLGTQHEVNRAIAAYVSLLHAKERAGLERALGAAGFSSGAFAPDVYRRFIELHGQQRAFLAAFEANGSAPQVAFYAMLLQGAVVEDVERMREVAIGSVFEGGLQDISAPLWFDTITKKIELYHTLEERLAVDLLITVNAVKEDALFMGDIAVIVALLALGVILGGVQAQRLSRALEKEKELNGLQRQFISLVSHEFRTPLAIIDMSAQRMSRAGDKVTPDQVARGAHKIRNTIVRLTDLMEGVLSASRLEEGKIQFEPAACDLTDLMTEICEDYQQINKTHRLTLGLQDLPKHIEADAKLLRQAFSNLVSNAIKYSPEGTSVQVTASQSGGDILITVRDQGVGIPAEELGRLFERFFRASTSTGVSGTGIGLHLVKHVIDLHGGTIDVESEPDQGTAFIVRLPNKAPERAPLDQSGVSSELCVAH